MDERVILQVPLSKSLKEKAEAVSSDYGFSSLQEIIRILLQKISRRELTIRVQEERTTVLSPKAEKRYAKIINDIKAGKNVTKTHNLKELMAFLES